VRNWLTFAAAIVAAAVLLASCGSAKESEKAVAAGKPMQLKVMEYNIEYGGTLVSLKKTEEALTLAGADVVGIEESYNNLPKIAKATGYPYYNVSLQILSRYPLYEPSGGDGLYALIEVQPGYVIAFCNIHLDSVKYGPTALLRGKPVDAVIAAENEVRTSALSELLPVLSQLARQGYPVFLTGDFNEPSSLDYVAATVGLRPQITEPVAWPVSLALFNVGFRDSYREDNPDPAKKQGITWPAKRPKVAAWAGNPTPSDPRDRIDYVYAAGPSKTLACEVMGEQGGPDVSLSVTPWPSDHRAVVSTFEVTPLEMPTMVAVNARLLTVGDTVTVTYKAPGTSGNKAAIVPAGGEVASPLMSHDAPGKKGSRTFDTSRLAAGGYEAVLTAGDGAEVARVPFWLRAKHAKVQLSTDKPTYSVGEPITVSWTDGPANRWDWIGVYKASAADPNVDYYLVWDYTGLHASGTVPPQVDGSVTLGDSSQGEPWPLPPGKYVVYYLLTDAYTSAGSADFTVTK